MAHLIVAFCLALLVGARLLEGHAVCSLELAVEDAIHGEGVALVTALDEEKRTTKLADFADHGVGERIVRFSHLVSRRADADFAVNDGGLFSVAGEAADCGLLIAGSSTRCMPCQNAIRMRCLHSAT